MIYSNVDFNVVYIDPSIEAPGDGTTPAIYIVFHIAFQSFNSQIIGCRQPDIK